MTTRTTPINISNDQYWNKIPSDQSLDIDDLFCSPLDFIYHNEYPHSYDNIITDETLSPPEIDQYQFQALSINSPPTDCRLPNPKCAVCGASAHGYNFDQITCESCKAFFRRNALRHMPNQQCRYTGSCVINIQTRRHCTYCRLKKCFDVNMRKDWIRTDEERELRQLQKLTKEQKKLNILTDDQQCLVNLPLVVRKKKRLMSTLTNSIVSQSMFALNRDLSDEDRILFNNINQAYQLETIQATGFSIHQCSSSASLIQVMNGESQMHETLIRFYKHIPDFKQLDLIDQTLLIKSNLHEMIHLHYILTENFEENPLVGIFMSKLISKEFHQEMSRTRRYFSRFINYPLILKLTLIVFLFSIDLSKSGGCILSNDYKNKRKLYESQNYYTSILWTYLNSLFDEHEAVKSMQIIVMQILRYQTLNTIMEEAIQQEKDSNTFNALLKSIFRLT